MSRDKELAAREESRGGAIDLSLTLRQHSGAVPEAAFSEGIGLAALEEEFVPDERALGQKRLMGWLWLVGFKEEGRCGERKGQRVCREAGSDDMRGYASHEEPDQDGPERKRQSMHAVIVPENYGRCQVRLTPGTVLI